MVNEALDVLEFLYEAMWKDIAFPTTKFRMSIAHDLAEHKYWGVDGARVESTGLAPLRFSFSSPLTTGIEPGKKETWKNLYPLQFRALVSSFQLKEKGYLVHPEYGRILCKAERMDIDWNAERRGGADCEMSFVATADDTDADSGELTTRSSPVKTIDNMAAADSPQFKADLKTLLLAAKLPLPPYLMKKTVSLSDMISDIKAIANYPAMLAYKGQGAIASLAYHAKEIGAAAERSRTAFSWPMTQQAEQMKETAFDAKQTLLQSSKNIGKFVVPFTTTLAGVCQQVQGAKLADLISLNPGIMANPVIETGAVVRYYL